MTDSTIVKPVSRRRFFMFLGAAAASPIIHSIIPEKLIFDMSVPVIAAPTISWRSYFKSISIKTEDIIYSPSVPQALKILQSAQLEYDKLYAKLYETPHYFGDQLPSPVDLGNYDIIEARLNNG